MSKRMAYDVCYHRNGIVYRTTIVANTINEVIKIIEYASPELPLDTLEIEYIIKIERGII